VKNRRLPLPLLACLLSVLSGSTLAMADINRHWGRVSLFAQAAQRSQSVGESSLFTELAGTLMYRATVGDEGGF